MQHLNLASYPENIESKKGQDKKMLPESESDKTRFWGPAEQAAFAGSAA